MVVPAIAAYELRRELVQLDKTTSLSRLDQFLDAEPDRYLPLTRQDLDRASALWAQARREGRPTAPDQALDGDVIVAAQALSFEASGQPFIIATSNPKHLARFAPAQHWRDLIPDRLV